MSEDHYDPLNKAQNAKYHISGLDPTREIHQFDIVLDKDFANRVRELTIPDEDQQQSADTLCDMFLDNMYSEILFFGDSYLIRKIRVGSQETGLHYHDETENGIVYGVKNVDYHTECVEIISVFSRWVEYANHQLSKTDN